MVVMRHAQNTRKAGILTQGRWKDRTPRLNILPAESPEAKKSERGCFALLYVFIYGNNAAAEAKLPTKTIFFSCNLRWRHMRAGRRYRDALRIFMESTMQ
jgi:hypothetical protein